MPRNSQLRAHLRGWGCDFFLSERERERETFSPLAGPAPGVSRSKSCPGFAVKKSVRAWRVHSDRLRDRDLIMTAAPSNRDAISCAGGLRQLKQLRQLRRLTSHMSSCSSYLSCFTPPGM